MEAFNKIEELKQEIAAASVETAEALEQFRIRFLGTKNIIKPLFSEIRNVPNEEKKNFGQAMNELKLAAEGKYEELSSVISSRQKGEERRRKDFS